MSDKSLAELSKKITARKRAVNAKLANKDAYDEHGLKLGEMHERVINENGHSRKQLYRIKPDYFPTKLDKQDAVWFAGVMDTTIGYGCRAKYKGRNPTYSPYIRVVSEYTDTVETIFKILNAGSCRFVEGKTPAAFGYRRSKSWIMGNKRELEWLLPQVIPYMRICKRHAEIILELANLTKVQGGWNKTIPEENIKLRKALHDELIELNEKRRKLPASS